MGELGEGEFSSCEADPDQPGIEGAGPQYIVADISGLFSMIPARKGNNNVYLISIIIREELNEIANFFACLP